MAEGPIEALDCGCWLVSTDGAQFRRPDAAALARVIAFSRVRQPLLAFNARSTYNRWWASKNWRTRYGYRAKYDVLKAGLSLKWRTTDD